MTRLWAPAWCLLFTACSSSSTPAGATVVPVSEANLPAATSPVGPAGSSAGARPVASAGPAASPEVPDGDDRARAEREATAFEELVQQTEQEWCAAPPKERCEAMRAFRRAGVPTVAATVSFTVGSEAGKANPADFLVMRFTPGHQPGTGVQVATTSIKADNAGEIADTQRYIDSIAKGKRDTSSPVHSFLQTPHPVEGFFKAREAMHGWELRNDGPRNAPGTTVLRQDGRSLYLFRLAIGGARPHLQLAVFPAP